MSNCVCGDLFCDGYNSACWDRETERLRAEGNRRVDEHYRLEQAVIDAARAFADEIDTVGLGKTWQLVYDAVRALDDGGVE